LMQLAIFLGTIAAINLLLANGAYRL
jgi:hypothetical protein